MVIVFLRFEIYLRFGVWDLRFIYKTINITRLILCFDPGPNLDFAMVDNRHCHNYNGPFLSFSQGKDVRLWQKESWR
ncbi:hypothetical protein D1AOALGA4SA_7042 [Olavius algarvensis Delta 1 endosymbiont]|nr:hypothetical protein D1AOALGA4SA_7042 [Olavius algarvensis Delta 1 endosymbiont]